MVNYKRHTRPCVYYQTNTCPFSAEDCDYTHIIATPEQRATLKMPQETLRTKPCRFYVAGNCKDAFWCRFKHPAYPPATSISEPKLFDEGKENNVSRRESMSQHDGFNSTNSEEAAYENVPDIRDVDKKWKARLEHHPKYRTRPCRNYLLGKCPYGFACSYLHVAPKSAPATSTSTTTSTSTQLPPAPPLSLPATAPLPSSTPTAHTPTASRNTTVHSPDSARSTTPSSTIASAMDEPVTPASIMHETLPSFEPYIALPSGLAAYPDGSYHLPLMSPGACGVQYATYPTSPVSMAVMRVPFMLPAMRSPQQQQHQMTTVPPTVPTAPPPTPVRPARLESLRPRSVSSHAITPRSVYFKTKPCRFFNEMGRCVKGDRCNFIHGEGPTSTTPTSVMSEPSYRLSQSQNEPTEQMQPRSESPTTPGSGNFYKINWRVVGGGVKIGSENAPRRHSEDQSVRPRNKLREPTRNREMSCVYYPRSPLSDVYGPQHVVLAPPVSPTYDARVHSPSPLALPASITEQPHVPSLLPSLMSIDSCVLKTPQRSEDSVRTEEDRNALSLSLQSYVLRSSSPTIPAIQGPHDIDDGKCEKLDWAEEVDEHDGDRDAENGDDDNGVLLGAKRVKLNVAAAIIRSKSSPSSPVCAPRELPKLFSAESP